MSAFNPWKILHLELSEGIPNLPFDPSIQGFYVVFWWHSIPFGHQEIPAARLPMDPSQLRELVLNAITPAVGDHLLFEQDFNAPLPCVSKNPCFSTASTSVVVCTRDRPEQLERCLRSLQKLSQRPHEILVIDNAPTSDATRRLVTQMSGIQYVLEPRPGLDVARNSGINHSRGDIIVFTDDDVTVHPDWIIRLQQGFQDPKVMAVAGLVLPAELETEAQVIFETCWSFNRKYRTRIFDDKFFEQTRHRACPVWKIGAGANMAFQRKVFEMLGGFDECLDVGAAGCCGDSELWYRVLAQGWLCHYEPAAVVYHHHRRELKDLKRQIYFYMRGHVTALLIQFEKHKHWGNLRRLLLALPKTYLKLIASGLLKGFTLRHRTLWAEIFGCFSGVKFYLLNRRPLKGFFLESRSK